MTGKDNTWRGRVQPAREKCPACGKRGLGPQKLVGGVVGQSCRYCQHFEIPCAAMSASKENYHE